MAAKKEKTDREKALEHVARIRKIQDKWGAAIIADGLFHNNDVFMQAIAEVVRADVRAGQAEKSLVRFFEKHPEANVDVPHPRPYLDAPDNTETLSDLTFEHAAGWGDAGFEIGLAVGMLLGPSALGGAR